MITLIFNSIAALLFLFVVWWFWIAKAKAVTVNKDIIDISVANGVYTPAVIKTTRGKLLTLRFFRHDASPCAEYVVIPDLNISEQLPLNKPHLFSLKIEKAGNYDFTCQMNMYRGKIIVTE